MKFKTFALSTILFLSLVGCQLSPKTQEAKINTKPVQETKKPEPEVTEFDKEIDEIEQTAQFERSILGEWSLQKLTTIKPGQKDVELSGGLANQSTLNIYPKNQLYAIFAGPKGDENNGSGYWYYNHDKQTIQLIIKHMPYLEESEYTFECKITKLKGRYMYLNIFSKKINGEEQFEKGEHMTAIVKHM